MPNNLPFFMSNVRDELNRLRRNWGCYLALGIALIVGGVFAIAYPAVVTVTTVEVFGYLLMFGAAIEIGSILWSRGWGGFISHLLCGLLYLFLGVVMVDQPALAAAGYTLLLAAFFVASGLFRCLFALSQRFSGWGWTLLSGGVSVLLGLMIWRDLPAAAFWVIGTFVGVELVFNGWSWVMLALGARTLPATGLMRQPAPRELVGV